MQQPGQPAPFYPMPTGAAPNSPGGPAFPVDCAYVADARTARRLVRATEWARWRSAKMWIFVATVPLLLMARRIVEILRHAADTGDSPLQLIGVYFMLFAAALVVGLAATGIRTLRRNPGIEAYAAAGTELRVRYQQDAMELPPATGYSTLEYQQITDFLAFGGAVIIRTDSGRGVALPREVVPGFAFDRLAESARTPRRRWAKPVLAAAAVMSVAVGVVFAVGVVAARNDDGGRTTISIASKSADGVMAFDPAAGKLYVAYEDRDHDADKAGGTVTWISALAVVDLATHAVTATLPLPDGPQDIAVDSSGRTVYVLSSSNREKDDSSVTVIDADTDTITAQIPIGGESERVAVDEKTHNAYVFSTSHPDAVGRFGIGGQHGLSLIRPGTTTAERPVPLEQGGYDFAVESDSGLGLIGAYSSVGVIDLSTNRVIDGIRLAFDADEIAYTRGKVFAVSDEGKIAVVDADSRSVVRTFDWPGSKPGNDGIGISAVAIDPEGRTLFIAGYQADEVLAVDTQTGSADTLNVQEPDHITVDPTTGDLVVFARGGVTIIPR
ncbi:hypothetical protein JK358_12355 [Nocardia sp. 2]|uniref:YVTN family beta-propeller protein n=1 Tax=Nocardia acididurans TaxID=2802282 RepID=A0ABS1M4Q7_9NOCA|nr:hypothetical protein [Nocardia acididurans]MBL1075184.1 hypothetical protein [Nocardia acididurans]